MAAVGVGFARPAREPFFDLVLVVADRILPKPDRLWEAARLLPSVKPRNRHSDTDIVQLSAQEIS